MIVPPDLSVPLQAAAAVARSFGVHVDRYEILQDSNTLVVRLSESLVARVVLDQDGPRKGAAWFERENAVALHLAKAGAPVIPLHPDIPPGPHQSSGYPINFWKFVTRIDEDAAPEKVGRTLYQCHETLRSFSGKLPELAIPVEALRMLDDLDYGAWFPESVISLLRGRLESSIHHLRSLPMQALHGDAHWGNLMNTTDGLLWTDWEDTFSGPVEWDLASIIWNARLLDEDHQTAEGILDSYRRAGGSIGEDALHHCLIARAAVMSVWYPILYPAPSEERQQKLRKRLDWLERC